MCPLCWFWENCAKQAYSPAIFFPVFGINEQIFRILFVKTLQSQKWKIHPFKNIKG